MRCRPDEAVWAAELNSVFHARRLKLLVYAGSGLVMIALSGTMVAISGVPFAVKRSVMNGRTDRCVWTDAQRDGRIDVFEDTNRIPATPCSTVTDT